MDELDFHLYVVAEMRYQQEFEKEVEEENLFPANWYSSRDYKLKTEIIAEAIKKHITIDKTDLYQKYYVEGQENKLYK